MQKTGLRSIENINKLSIIGFVEVIKHVFFFIRLTNKVLEEIRSIKPIQIILIDYPGFNLRLAKKIKKRFDISITYYISPQLWAWKENRIKIIRKCVDQMLVIFPFEESWYKKRGIEAKFVGHPIFDEWEPTSKRDLCNIFQFKYNRPILILYPGSRRQELNRHLPLFIKVSKKLKNLNPKIQFILGLAIDLDLDHFSIPEWIHIERENPQKALECADIALVASGTATLEAAVFGTPMIIIYKMATLSWWLSKLLVKTNYAGMVNIIAGKKIMPEYLQNKAITKSITIKAFQMLSNSETNDKLKSELLSVCQKLQGEGASKKAAEHILSLANLQ